MSSPHGLPSSVTGLRGENSHRKVASRLVKPLKLSAKNRILAATNRARPTQKRRAIYEVTMMSGKLSLSTPLAGYARDTELARIRGVLPRALRKERPSSLSDLTPGLGLR